MSTEFKVGQKVKGTTSFEGEITYVYASGDLPLLEVRTAERHHLVVRKTDAQLVQQATEFHFGSIIWVRLKDYTGVHQVAVLKGGQGVGRKYRLVEGGGFDLPLTVGDQEIDAVTGVDYNSAPF